ncbi:MAG: 3-hydroxyacyl-ACP dehydratase FabZ, partial [Thermodesulfobacteriota bacterium]
MDTIDIKKVLALLPQRYPFVMIDRVLELVPNKSIRALKNVSAGEPWAAGHFPGNPVMPGVLIVEAMCQAGGVLVGLSRQGTPGGGVRYLTGLDKVRFRKKVVPGDTLMLYAAIVKEKLNTIKIEASAEVDGVLVAEAQIMASLLPPES